MKYSITIPCYKSQYLKECLNSVLSQTYEDYEVIILNDASPENVSSIVSSFEDARIRYYENKRNVGAANVVDNWNRLLELANGEYIICIGDDDMLSPNYLENYNKLIEKFPELAVYHSRTEIIDEFSQFVGLQESRPEWESVYSMIWHRTFCNRIQFIGDYMFHIETLRKDGGFYKQPLAWESDCITSYIAASHAGIANGIIPTFQYRQNRKSITCSTNWPLKMEATRNYRKWLKSFLMNRPTNDLDIKYYLLLKDNSDEVIAKHLFFMLANCIKSSPFLAWRQWYIHHKEDGIPLYRFAVAGVLALFLLFKDR